MFRNALMSLGSKTRSLVIPSCTSARNMSNKVVETDDEFDQRYIAYFNRKDIDGWELRKALNDLQGMDMVMDPKILISALHACRRLNDYAATTRLLEGVQWKAAGNKEIWPYVLQEIQPTLTELGISTPQEMGYDKPELAQHDPHALFW